MQDSAVVDAAPWVLALLDLVDVAGVGGCPGGSLLRMAVASRVIGVPGSQGVGQPFPDGAREVDLAHRLAVGFHRVPGGVQGHVERGGQFLP